MTGAQALLVGRLNGRHCGSTLVHGKRRYKLSGVFPAPSGSHVRLEVRRGVVPTTLVLNPTDEVVIEP
ncbi:hypothetical protein GS504_15780 [Rhodococcus hoagii]|nr:hypothetical protein [Prescottella equi]